MKNILSKEAKVSSNISINSRELLPSSKEERTVGLAGYFAMWIGMAVIIATFSLGGSGVEVMTLPMVILACLLGNLLTGTFLTLSGDIGLEHGIPFPMYLRVTFGPIGSAIPSLIRAILACCWTGIQTYYGATAMSFIVAYFTGFDNWFICFVIFLAVQVLNTAFGIAAIDKFAKFAAPCIILISIWIVYNILGIAEENSLEIWTSIYVPGKAMLSTSTGVAFQVFMVTLVTNASYWSTNAADNQSLTKYLKVKEGERNWFKRNKSALIAHLVSMPLTQCFCVGIGAMSMLTLGTWNPIEAMQQTASGVALVFLLLLIVLAQWSTNTAGSILPGSMTLMNVVDKLFKRNLPFKVAVLIVGVGALALQPWKIMEMFPTFLGLMGSVYGPICGIFLADYYILRKRRVNVPEIFNNGGQYDGVKGWNFAGILALIIGVIMGNLLSGYAFFVGIGAGLIAYYLLAKFWWFKKFPQAEIEDEYDDKYLGVTVGNYWQEFQKDIERK